MMRNITEQSYQYYEEHAYQNLTPSLISSFVIGLVLSYIAIALRCYARRISDANFDKDDVLCIMSLIPVTAMAIAGFISPRYGFGKHIIFAKDVRAFIEVILTGTVAYVIATMLIKSSILFFYCRIFVHNKRLKKLSWMIIIWAGTYNLALILVMAFGCIPFSALWTYEPGRCINIVIPEGVLGILNVFTDILILMIPVRLVCRLQMNLARKISLIGVFLTGAIIIVFSILRVVAILIANPDDATYTYVWPAIAFYCEMFIGLIAACLPTYSIFFDKGIFVSITAAARGRLSRTFERLSRSSKDSEDEKIIQKHRTLPEPPLQRVISHELPARRAVSCMPAPRTRTTSPPPRLPSHCPGSPMSFTYENWELHFREQSQDI